MHLRHMLVTGAVAGTAGALAFTAPVVARSVFDAKNAHKVDGLHAAQLTKVQFFASDTDFDNFDGCTSTAIMTRTFKAPHAGVISVVGTVNAARDANDPDEGILTTRIYIDGTRAGIDNTVNLENSGIRDGSVTSIGGRKVTKGNHTLEIQAEECGDGMAFILGESMSATYSPFGAAPAAPPAGTKAKGSLNR